MKTIICLAIVAAAILVGVAVTAQPHPWPYASNIDDKLTRQIADILADSLKIKPGMTRADLLKTFTTEGGFYSARQRKFVYNSCPYIKVDVEFDVPATQVEERPTDIITKISKPYLEQSISD